MAGGSLGKLFVSLGVDTSGLTRGFDRAGRDINGFGGMVAEYGKKTGLVMTGVGAASLLMSRKLSNSFMALDTAMAGVRKTTGMTADEILVMKDSFIDLSTVMPTAADDLANIGAIAGQLGIKGKENILGFTEDIAKMAVAFDMSAEDSATAMAKMAKIYDIQIDKVDALGSAINVLGNTTAAKESQIMNYSMALGAVADTMGFTATESLALGATLISMGQDASRAGTGINSALTFISKDSATAAAALGMTEKAFSRAFGDDPMHMIMALAEKIGSIKDPLEQNAMAVDVFGTYGAKAMVALSADLDGLTTNLEAAAIGFEENTSLTEEYANATDTLAAKLQIAENRQEAAAISLGGAMAPATLAVAGATAMVADAVAALPGPLQTAAGMALTLGQSFVVLGPLLMGVSAAMNMLKVTTFSAVIPALAAHAVAAWAAIAPYLIIIAPILAVIAILAILEHEFGFVTAAISALSGVFGPLIAGIKGFLGIANDAADAAEELAWGVEEEARFMDTATIAADALAEAQKRVADSAGEVDALTSAYEDLQDAISDALGLTEDMDDQSRAIEHATFGLEDAEQKYADAISEHGASSTEAAKADLRRRDAIDRLDDAQKKLIKLQGEEAAANTKKTNILAANNVKDVKGLKTKLDKAETILEDAQAGEIIATKEHNDAKADLQAHQDETELKAQERGAIESERQARKAAEDKATMIMSAFMGPVGALLPAIAALNTKFNKAGTSLMTTFADGIRSGISWAVDAVSDAVDEIMSYLPSSDAKVGPLSNLTASGAALMTTFEKGIASGNVDLSSTVEHIMPQSIMAAQPAAHAPASNNTTNSSSISMGDVNLSNDFDFEALMMQINRHQAQQRTQRGAV